MEKLVISVKPMQRTLPREKVIPEFTSWVRPSLNFYHNYEINNMKSLKRGKETLLELLSDPKLTAKMNIDEKITHCRSNYVELRVACAENEEIVRSVPECIIREFLNDSKIDVVRAIAGNPSLSHRVELKEIIKLALHKDSMVRRKIMQNKDAVLMLPEEVIKNRVMDSEILVRIATVNNNNAMDNVDTAFIKKRIKIETDMRVLGSLMVLFNGRKGK